MLVPESVLPSFHVYSPSPVVVAGRRSLAGTSFNNNHHGGGNNRAMTRSKGAGKAASRSSNATSSKIAIGALRKQRQFPLPKQLMPRQMLIDLQISTDHHNQTNADSSGVPNGPQHRS